MYVRRTTSPSSGAASSAFPPMQRSTNKPRSPAGVGSAGWSVASSGSRLNAISMALRASLLADFALSNPMCATHSFPP